MTRIEREDLLKVCRMRAKVAKGEVDALAAAQKADFAAQLAAIYHWDTDEIWKQAKEAATAITARANEQIRERARELGIPPRFMPGLDKPYWYGRGENATASRRVELTRVAHTRIEQHQKEAKLRIERAAVEIQTKLVADGLASADAKHWLESMPTAAQLMPPVNAADVQKLLGAPVEDESEDDL